jgi:hypothetical protein
MLARGYDRFPPQPNATPDVGGALRNVDNPGDGLFTYRQLQSLPADVTRLRARIIRAVRAQAERNVETVVHPGPRRRQRLARVRRNYPGPQLTGTELVAISDLYASPIAQRVRALLYEVATGMPVARRTGRMRDGRGRLRVGITRGGPAALPKRPPLPANSRSNESMTCSA